MSLVKTGSPAPSRPLLGIALMLVAVTMGSSLDATAKWFTQHYPVPQLVCIRFGVQAAVLLALAPWIGRRAVLTTRAPFTHVARGVAMILASGLFVAAPLAVRSAQQVVPGSELGTRNRSRVASQPRRRAMTSPARAAPKSKAVAGTGTASAAATGSP